MIENKMRRCCSQRATKRTSEAKIWRQLSPCGLTLAPVIMGHTGRRDFGIRGKDKLHVCRKSQPHTNEQDTTVSVSFMLIEEIPISNFCFF